MRPIYASSSSSSSPSPQIRRPGPRQRQQRARQRRHRWWWCWRLLRSAACLAVCCCCCPIAAAKTTFGNCTYDGALGPSSKTLRFADITDTVGSLSWGVSIDTSLISIDEYIEDFGRSHAPAIINLYFDTAHLGGLNDPLNCRVAATKAAGAILMLTIEPWDGLASVDRTKVAQLAQLCRSINDAGVPLFLRFAHEMNGDWVRLSRAFLLHCVFPWCLVLVFLVFLGGFHASPFPFICYFLIFIFNCPLRVGLCCVLCAVC